MKLSGDKIMKKSSKKIIFICLTVSLLILSTTIENMIVQSNQNFVDHSLPSINADPLIVIDEDSDFFAFPGYGNESHPYIIEGYDIVATTSDDIGILVANTTKHFEIRNNNIYSSAGEGDIGIFVVNVTANTAKILNNNVRLYRRNIYAAEAEGIIIDGNIVRRVGAPGIRVEYCPYARVENNDVYNLEPASTLENNPIESTIKNYVDPELKYFGIFMQYCTGSNITANSLNQLDTNLGGGIVVFSSNDLLIDENLVINVQISVPEFAYLERAGMYLKGVTNATIAKNTISNTDKTGLLLESCNNLLVTNNTIEESETNGITLTTTPNSNITYNVIQNNPGFGIILSAGSSNNIIHHNHFINNKIGSSQASDSGDNNIWYDSATNEGNWWNDWTGGDYQIDGITGSVDPYPLGDPVAVPEISVSKIWLLTAIPILCLVATILRKRK